MLRVIFLGTAGSLPTMHRSLTSIAIRRKAELILFDCGEGTQRQMIFAKVGFCRKMKVFITHMHGDHVLGLPGLFQSMSLLDRRRPLEVYGPQGIREFVDSITRTVRFTLTYPIQTHEVDEGVACQENEYKVYAVWGDHVVPSLAYALVENKRPGRFYPEKARALRVPKGPLWSRLQRNEKVELPGGRTVTPEQVTGPPRPGRKIVYTGDTRPSQSILRLAEDADLLIHDSTFDDSLAEKAYEDGHSTPSQAAQIARDANAKKLILTHISARYDDAKILVEQARKTFPNVQVAEDLMELEIPYLE